MRAEARWYTRLARRKFSSHHEARGGRVFGVAVARGVGGGYEATRGVTYKNELRAIAR